MTAEQDSADLARRMAWLEWRLHWAEWKIGQLERYTGIPAATPPPPQSEAVAVPGPHGAVEVSGSAAATEEALAGVVPPPLPPPVVAPAVVAPRPPFDWESIIGVRLFSWLGGAALFVAAALFLNYSIQQNLISPTLRVAIGLVLGAAALVGGEKVREKADRAGQAIGGAGIATLYASLFAAHSLWHLVPSTVAFVGMALVTLTAGALAVKRDAFMLAVLGLLGGFVTPYLVSTGEDRPLALFGYLALLDAGIVVVASKKKWPSLGLLGVFGSGLVFTGWAFKFLDADKAPFALLAGAILCGLFALTTLDASRRKADGEGKGLLSRVTGALAAALPLVLALVVSGTSSLAVSPVVLVGYLLILSAGAWFAGRRTDVSALMPLAATFGAVGLTLRVDGLLFPLQRATTLAVFTVFPAAWFALWLARRRAPEARSLQTAAALALSGTPLGVAIHASVVDGGSAGVVPLAIYTWVHIALLLAIGGLSDSPRVVLQGLAVAALSLGVTAFGFDTRHLDASLVVVAVPMIAFWSLPTFVPAFRRGTWGWGVAAFSFLVHFPFLYGFAQGQWSDGALGAASVGCGLLTLATLVVARRSSAEPESDIAALLGGTALLFFTGSIPILLSDEWLTVAWALEVAALAWLRLRVKHRGLLLAAGLLALGTLARLLTNPAVLEYHPRSGVPILNWWLYSYGVSGLSLLAAFRLLQKDAEAIKLKLPAFFAFAGGALLFVLLNIEIADFYSTGSTVTFRFSGGGFEQDTTYTLAWGVFALTLFGLGMATRSKPARIWAIVLVCVTVGKGALHDVWSLGSLYRVGAIVGLAVTLLAVSYLTQRFVLRPEGDAPAPVPPPAPHEPMPSTAARPDEQEIK